MLKQKEAKDDSYESLSEEDMDAELDRIEAEEDESPKL